MEIGSRVRQYRTQRGLSQSDLATLLDWSPAKVAHIESGRWVPNARDLAGLAGALRCRTDDLLPPTKIRHARA